jgi:hypothetical protein
VVCLEVEGGHVVKNEAGRAEPGVRGAGLRQPLPPGLLRIDGQAPLQGAVGRRRHPGLLQHPQRVQLAGRFNDPGQHQVPEHIVPAGRVIEAQHLVGALEGVHQVAHPRRRNRQRSRRPGTVQAQAELQLPGRDPLLRCGLQRLELRFAVRRPQVLDLTRTAPRRPHDLHRSRARRGLHCPHARHRATLRAGPSAQVQLQRTENPQVSNSRHQPQSKRGPSQVKRGMLILKLIGDTSVLAVPAAPECDLGLVSYEMALLASTVPHPDTEAGPAHPPHGPASGQRPYNARTTRAAFRYRYGIKLLLRSRQAADSLICPHASGRIR